MDNSINIYDIYDDVCDPGEHIHTLTHTHHTHLRAHTNTTLGEARLQTQMSILLDERRHALQEVAVLANANHRRTRAVIGPVFPTCIDKSSASYLNQPEVQQAIHVRPGTVPNGKWSDCGNVDYDFNYESELENYKEWVAASGDASLQILIYNGDADYILSHMGNAAWINEGLQLPKAKAWNKWRGSDGQVAGYYEQYKTAGSHHLSFLTIKGAGHMVPRDRPQHALDFFARFLAGGGLRQGARGRDNTLVWCLSFGVIFLFRYTHVPVSAVTKSIARYFATLLVLCLIGSLRF